MPVVGSAQCSQKLTTSLQPCMQKDFGGNRAACMNEAVGHSASAVCDHLWERCEGLRSLTMYLHLGQAVSGCPMREGMFGVSQVLAIILASSLLRPALISNFKQVPLYQLALSSSAGITSGREMCLPRIPKEDGELSVATIGPTKMLKWFVVSLGEAKLSNSMDRLHLPLTHQWMVQAHALGICLLDLCMSLSKSPVLALKVG